MISLQSKGGGGFLNFTLCVSEMIGAVKASMIS
jgi:hypothetical protein